MGKYDGCKCLSCGLEFTGFDDIVVCPECGTPYHRDCYEKEGKCINTELHESGASWSREGPAAAEQETSGEPVRCFRCGLENPPEGLFCKRCGMPLRSSFRNEPRPFNEGQSEQNAGQSSGAAGFNPYANPNAMRFDQDSDIDGVKLGDLARFVGKNQFSYLASFIRFGKFGSKISLNFSALLFPQYYFFYRKMTLIGIIYMVLTLALSIPTIMLLSAAGYLPSISFVTESYIKSNAFFTLRNISSTLLMVMQCLSAIFANYWYYKTARRNIQQARSQDGADEEVVKDTIAKKGGVSLRGFFMALLISNALVVGSVFIMNKL